MCDDIKKKCIAVTPYNIERYKNSHWYPVAISFDRSSNLSWWRHILV